MTSGANAALNTPKATISKAIDNITFNPSLKAKSQFMRTGASSSLIFCKRINKRKAILGNQHANPPKKAEKLQSVLFK